MRECMALMVLVTLAACHGENVQTVDIGSAEEQQHDAEVAQDVRAEPEPVQQVEPDAVEAVPTVSARVAAGGGGALRARSTPVLRAPGQYAYEVDRARPEAEIIGDDLQLLNLTALVIARTCVSEANWGVEDCQAIYRVVRRNRGPTETLMGSLRRHSRYTSEQWVPRSRRTRWVVELNLEGTRPPSFPEELNWERDYLPRWQGVLALAHRMLAGRDLGVCARAPIMAWGGRCDVEAGACDDHIARSRGLVPYERCGETANRFWCRPGSPGCGDELAEAEAADAAG